MVADRNLTVDDLRNDLCVHEKKHASTPINDGREKSPEALGVTMVEHSAPTMNRGRQSNRQGQSLVNTDISSAIQILGLNDLSIERVNTPGKFFSNQNF